MIIVLNIVTLYTLAVIFGILTIESPRQGPEIECAIMESISHPIELGFIREVE